MKKLAMKMLSLLLVLSLLLPTCVFAQPGQDEDGTPGTQRTTSEETTTFTEGGNGGGNGDETTKDENGGGNGDENSDTSTGGGNGDGNADTSTGGGNGDGNTKDVNGGSVTQSTTSEKTTTFTEGEDGDTPTEEPIVATVSIAVAAEDDDDDFSQEELLEGYLYSISGLYGEGAAVFRAPSKPLPVETQQVYDELQPMVLGVANGTGTTTEFAITKTWTKDRGASGWGIPDGDTIFTTNAEGKNVLTDAASEAIGKFLDVDALMQRMLSTMPYELYWFDKTGGHGMRVTYGASLSGSDLTVYGLKISMWVAQTYAMHNGDGTYNPFTPNTTVTSAASTAVTNATNIVNANSTKRDYQKLEEYRKEICRLVAYNYTAAGSGYTGGYGDPWQLINVFDHTNENEKEVVCEGYAKAFKYLCDLSAFSDTYLSCYLVTGNMTGGTGEGGSGAGGGHMWNVVHIGGNNYLVDVTNCDTGTIGATDKLFLCGVEDQTNGESYRVTIDSSVISFSYDAATKEYYTKDELTLSAVKYEEPAMPALGGTVTITGASSPNPKIGETLTANTSGLDYNGATGTHTLSYQWKADGGNVGSNSDKYTVQVGDYNKTITVTVTNSNNTGSVSSAETAAVVKKDGSSAPAAPVVKDATAVGFTYTAIAGQQYAISTNSVSPADSEWGDVVTTGGDKVVTGKNANTDYYIYTRVAETDEAYASAASTGTPVKTLMSALPSHFYCATYEAVYTGSANGATVTSTVHSSSEFTLKYNGASTAPTNVGKYTLTAEVKAHGSFAATTVELGTWEIKPKTIDVTWGSTTLTYTGLAQAPAISSTSGAVSGETVSVGVKEVTKKTDASPAGSTYTAEAEILSVTGGQAKADNYVISSTTKTQTYTINAATITVNPGAFTDYTGAYDGSPHSITVNTSKITTVNNQPITIKYGTASGTYNLGAAPTATNVSESMTVHYKITAPNHKAATGTAKITINQAAIDVSAFAWSTAVSFPYDGNDHSVTLTNLPAHVTANYTDNAKKYVGNYTASATLHYDTANYTLTGTLANCSWKITPVADPAVITDAATVTKNLTVNLGDNVTGDMGDVSYSITTPLAGCTVDPSTGVFTAGSTTGTCVVTVTVADKDVDGDGTREYIGTTKTITVTVADKTSAPLAGGVTQSGCTYGETLANPVFTKPTGTTITTYFYEGTLTKDGSYYTGLSKPTEAGNYMVKVTCETATHIYMGTALFTIEQKDISGMDVTLSKSTTPYTGSSQSVTVSSVGTLILGEYTVGGTTSGTQVGTYTVTVTGHGNYKGTADKTWEIKKATLTITGATVVAKTYDGTDGATVSSVAFSGLASSDTLTRGTDYDVSGVFNSVNVNSANKVTVTVTLKDTATAKNYELASATYDVTGQNIAQAAAPTAPTGLNGVKGNTLSTVALPAGWAWVNGSTVMSTVGSQTFKANYTDAAGNYANATDVDVTVNVMDKTDVSGKISFNDGTLVYTGAGQRYETASISGITAGTGVTWTYAYTAGTGTLDGGLPKTVGTYTVTVTYEDSLHYGTKSVTLTITQATPTGAPKFTKITSSGKTLGDAALVKTVSGPGDGFSVAGTVEWVDGSGTALADSTSVEANKSYGWKFTPADSNYKSISGSVVVYTVRRVSHSGGAAADSAAAAAAQPTVYSGSRGESVKTLQERLNAKGYNAGSVDGIFGKNTQAAVMAFQKANGLAADGIVGKLTWAKLYDTTAALPAASTATGTQPMVYRGSRGDAVRKLQELLNKRGFDCGAVDGIFGSKTYAAVVAFQKANGLSADGIVGPLTWGKLG